MTSYCELTEVMRGYSYCELTEVMRSYCELTEEIPITARVHVARPRSEGSTATVLQLAYTDYMIAIMIAIMIT